MGCKSGSLRGASKWKRALFIQLRLFLVISGLLLMEQFLKMWYCLTAQCLIVLG